VTTSASTSPARHTPAVSAIRIGSLSGRVPFRASLVAAVGVVVLTGGGLVSLSVGDVHVPVVGVVGPRLGHGDPLQAFVVEDLRLPRVTTGLLVGAALGLSGALPQTFARNPLASPDILGVTEGAAVGAVAVIILGGSGLVGTSLSEDGSGAGGIGVPVAALVGAFAAATLVYLLAWRGGIGGQRLVLVGIGCSAALSAVTSWLLVHAQLWDARAASVWLTGSLGDSAWDSTRPLAVALVVLGPVALALGPTLRALQLGDDSARSLGVRLQLAHLATLVVAVGLAAFAVSAAGPIAFVAFVVPQAVMRLARASRPPLLGSAVYGGVLVVAADLVARVVIPGDLPVGLLTAILGAPYLIWILVRLNRKAPA
jgi:iron complex transport system permease protein